jgi:hypothetical protein
MLKAVRPSNWNSWTGGRHGKIIEETKYSKGTEVKMVKNPPPVNNLTLVELDFFNGITGKGIINQPTTSV